MKRQEFLDALSKSLSGIPKHEIIERLNFYSEMIDDRIEDGLSEEDAVADIGTVSFIALQITNELQIQNISDENSKQKSKLRATEIVLIALGAPIWISLLVSAFAIFISLICVLYSAIISVWAITLSLAVGGVGSIIFSLISAITDGALLGLVYLFTGIFSLGISLLFYLISRLITEATFKLTKKIFITVFGILRGKKK